MADAYERTNPSLEERLARLEEKLDRLAEARGDQGRGEQTAYWAILESILPADARRHFRNASREQLLAARSMLDAWVKRMESGENEASSPRETIPLD